MGEVKDDVNKVEDISIAGNEVTKVVGKTNPPWLSDKFKVVNYEGTVKVNGQTRDVSRQVYQNNEISWDYLDSSTGLTNRQRAKLGNAPIGLDGHPRTTSYNSKRTRANGRIVVYAT